MTRVLTAVPLLVIGLVGSTAAQQVPEQEAHRTGQNVLDAWNKASQHKDAVAMAALFTEDGVRVTPHGLISGRAAIEKDAAEGFTNYRPNPTEMTYTKIIGNDLMLRGGTWSGVYNGPSGPVQVMGYWSDTAIREGDMWRICLETYNVNAVPEPGRR